MREILFRGKRLDNGEWVEGWYQPETTIKHWDGIQETVGVTIAYKVEDGSLEDTLVDPSTVGQYTGLTDKTGKRIFEGDVVTGMVHGPSIWTGQVIWIDRIAGFGLKWINRDAPTAFENCSLLRFLTSQGGHPDEYLAEVICNIHDNPEMLKGGEG